jgi:hypothetical protein
MGPGIPCGLHVKRKQAGRRRAIQGTKPVKVSGDEFQEEKIHSGRGFSKVWFYVTFLVLGSNGPAPRQKVQGWSLAVLRYIKQNGTC